MLTGTLRSVRFVALIMSVILALFLGFWIYDADTRVHSAAVGQGAAEVFFDYDYLTFAIYSPSDQPEGTVLDWGGRGVLPGYELNITVGDSLGPGGTSKGQMCCLFLRIWWPILLMNLSAMVFIALSFVLPWPGYLRWRWPGRFQRRGFPIQPSTDNSRQI